MTGINADVIRHRDIQTGLGWNKGRRTDVMHETETDMSSLAIAAAEFVYGYARSESKIWMDIPDTAQSCVQRGSHRESLRERPRGYGPADIASIYPRQRSDTRNKNYDIVDVVVRPSDSVM